MGKSRQGIYALIELNEEKRPTPLSLELIGLGGELASKLNQALFVVILGHGTGAAAELSCYGAEEVLVLDNESLAQYNPDVYLPILARLCEERKPRALIFGHTSLGQDLAPRLAFYLGAGLITDCVGVEVEGDCIDFVKPTYGGNALATQRAKTGMVLATLRVRVGDAPPKGEAGKTTPIDADIPSDTRLVLRGRERLQSEECPLEEAPVVISGGRGMGGEQCFDQLRELASLLGGSVGASRPPVDSGWAPTTCQVGITGKVVAPELYIAVAISGASQHLSGMSDSGKIIAINKDPEAYVFSVSDYGVVGDWKQVLPSFTSKIRELLSE